MKSFLKGLAIVLILLCGFTINLKAQKVKITTTPQSAKIFVNGVSMGAGQLVVTVPSNECITVEIREEGFVPEVRTYCKKRGVTTILSKFDVLENNDEKLGYLRTSWVGVTFKTNTVRMRVIIKQSSEDPLSYKIKFVSEYSGRAGTAFNADEQYRSFDRILKKYDGFLEEMSTKLKN